MTNPLLEKLKSKGIEPLYEGVPSEKTDIGVIDGDTIRTGDHKIRFEGLNAPETAHLDLKTLTYAGGQTGGDILKAYTENKIENEGFDNPHHSQKDRWGPDWLTGTKDAYGKYGRNLGDTTNDTGDSLIQTALLEGWSGTNKYSTERQKNTKIQGELDRAIRADKGQRTAEDLRFEEFQDYQKSMSVQRFGVEYAGMKPVAPSERIYAQNPDLYSGVSVRDHSRSMLNEVKGIQLDDAWGRGKAHGAQGLYTTLGVLGDVLGIDGVKDYGFNNSARIKNDLNNLPMLRGGSAFDENGQWTLDGFSETLEHFSTQFAQSLPVMGLTLLSAIAAIPTYGASLSVPLAIYGGQNVEGQEGEKEYARAYGFAVLQTGLDLVGAKGLGSISKNFFTSSAARNQVISEVAKQNGISKVAAERTLLNAMKGVSDDAVQIAKDQLGRAVVTRKSQALGVAGLAGVGALEEASTESLQEYFGILAENNNLSPDKIKNRLLESFVSGGVLGGTTSGVGAAASVLPNINANAGLSPAQKAIKGDIRREQDRETFGYEVNNKEAFDWVQNQNLDSKKSFKDDPLRNENNISNLAGDTTVKDKPKGTIDKVLDGVSEAWKGNSEFSFREAADQGPIISRTLSPILGDRGNGTMEEQKQLRKGEIDGFEVFDEKIMVGKLGLRNKEEFAEFYYDARNQEFITDVLKRNRKTGQPVAQIIQDFHPNVNVDAGFGQFLDQLAKSNNIGAKKTGNTEFNLAERGFSPHKAYKRQTELVEDLQKFKGLSRDAAVKLSHMIANTENFNNPTDAANPLLNVSDFRPSAKSLEGITDDPRFEKYLEDDVFVSIANNANKAASISVNRDYWGVNGEKVAKGLNLAVDAREITPETRKHLAKRLKKYGDQLSGVDGIITNRPYNLAMNLLTTTTALTRLTMATISSFAETMVSLFHNNPQPIKSLEVLAKTAGLEFLSYWNEVANMMTGGRIPMKEYAHRRQLRELDYMGEQQAPAARQGAEFSPGQARLVNSFFKATGLNSLTNIQRFVRLSMAEDVVNSFVAQAAIHYPEDGAAPSKFYKQAREMLDLLGVESGSMIDEHYYRYILDDQATADKIREANNLDEYTKVAMLRFTDMAIMTPRKGNRPWFYSDPRFRLFTTFQGYTSTATANLLPQIFQNLGGKDKLPTERVGAVNTIVGMLVMAALGNALKDALRGKEGDDETDHKDLLRTLYSSGLAGTAQRPIDLLFPLYGPPKTNLGRGAGNVSQGLGSVVNNVIGQSPGLEYADSLGGAGYSHATDGKNKWRDLLDVTPFVGTILKDNLTEYQKEK